jgi:large subunit ribosomal protein L22
MKEENKQNNKKKAIVRGLDLPISFKYAREICTFIKNKSPQQAIKLLESVTRKEIAVPMRGQIAHKKNMPKGKPAGRYPVNASKEFIKLLKSLIANAGNKGMDTENLIIKIAKADRAPRPQRGTRMAFGRKQFKRAHVLLETQEGAEKKKEMKVETKPVEKIEHKKVEEKKEVKKEESKEKEHGK